MTVFCFPNNNPWVTKDIKASLNRKKAEIPFRSGDKEEVKKVQIELRELRKLERKLQQKDIRKVWSGMRTITGHGKKTDQGMKETLMRAMILRSYNILCRRIM
ncbi:hypothetical protein N1851_006978 [Merluccius polli]|uniref:Uncharacterized protein n=1 Tax=Merluccius polli TaxID=89951 RepID=A0AA47P5Q4_MERPO|nr:hypothetical protein N1851_006978 [Merluccius polli]